MTDTQTPDTEKTMSGLTTDGKKLRATGKGKGKGKAKRAAKGKASNGELATLAKLDRAPARGVQETFRVTPDEHNELVAMATKEHYGSMSDFFREKLGLGK